MKKINLTLEIVVLLIHLITGAFTGYLRSINETQVAVSSSIILYTSAMFILWGIARLKGKYLFFEVESVLHGTIIGVIIATTTTTLNLIEGDISENIVTPWLIRIGTGLVIGGIYGKFAEIRTKSKVGNKP
jgi:hypothetical protein